MRRWLPFTDWLFRYQKSDLPGDLTAAVIVTVMLIPQSLAYAMLAGLPPQYGLYASIAPLVAYGLLGTSRTLSVGPVAVISLLTASTLAPHAEAGGERYVQLALLLALIVGVISLVLGLLRAGFVASLLSHPVVAGFITGSSLLIIVSQLPHLLGVSGGGAHTHEMLASLARAASDTNFATLILGLASLVLLVFFRAPLRGLLRRAGVPAGWSANISRAGPALLVLAAMGAVALFGLEAMGVRVVGEFPRGLPGLTVPEVALSDVWLLLPGALAIVLVGYVESISVGRSLGARRRQAIEPDNELVALGAANIASGLTGGFPVTGGFSRSVVNFDAGARTGLASLVTAVLIALVALFAAPWFALLPQVVLAATVIVAVSTLVDFDELRRLWRFSRPDALLMALTLIAVLGAGVEAGVAVGVAASILAFLWRAGRPHMAVVGRVGDSEHFRNVQRHEVKVYPGVLLVRIDRSLFFANVRFIEDRLVRLIAGHPGTRHLVLIFSAVNEVDADALHTLENLVARLKTAAVTLHLAEVKGPVLDQLRRADFERAMEPGRLFLSTHEAASTLAGQRASTR